MPVYGGSVLSTGAVSTAMSTNLQGQAFLASFQQALAAANGTNGQQMNADANALWIQLAVSQLAGQAPSPSALPFGEDATSSAHAAAAAASQFAAGFAAATALSQQNQFQSIWGQALAPQFLLLNLLSSNRSRISQTNKHNGPNGAWDVDIVTVYIVSAFVFIELYL